MRKAALLVQIDSSRRRNFSGGWIFIIIVFIASNSIYFTDDLNADWKAYSRLFEEDGAWLANSGRDPGFVFLVELIKSIGGYEHFRIIIGIYFLIFTTWFLCRWRSHLENNIMLWSFAGLLPLLIPKYTVQIREGLAQTLVLLAFTLLYEREWRLKILQATWLPFILLVLAGSIHGSTIIFLLAALIPFCVHNIFGSSNWQRILLFSALISVLGIVIGLSMVKWDEFVLNAASTFLGDLSSVEAETNIFKVVYWAVKCALVIYLIGRVNKISPALVIFGSFLRYMAYVIIPALQFIVLYLIFSEYPGFISSVAIRAYHTAFYLVFALTSLAIRTGPVNFVIAAALLLDEYRVMTVLGDD